MGIEIDKSTFLSRLESINAQKEKLSAQIEKEKRKQIDRNPSTYTQIRVLIKDYNKAEMFDKRRILASLINRITIFSDGTTKIQWRF